MIPRVPLELDSVLPAAHTGWTPAKDDLSEDGEGFGCFRGTWLIRGIGKREARGIVAVEQALVEVAERLATDAIEFDSIAGAFEDGEIERLSGRLRHPAVLAELEPHLDDVSLPLDGLELGVAGLVFALAAVGCWPAASCRGHPTERAWSDHPVVLLACDRHRAQVLQELVDASGCGFNVDDARPELLVVEAETIENLMSLARVALDASKTFVRRREARPRPHADDAQGSFDI